MPDGDRTIDRDELLARIDLAQVLDAVTTGDGEGHRRTWNCPEADHPDIHPSVTIHTDRKGVQRWRCWSGGHGGTAIDAVIAARHLDVGTAIRWLDDHYAHLRPLNRGPADPRRSIGDPAREVVEYVERCAKLLWTGSGREIRDWLNNRGYSDDVLAVNKVGADPGRRYLPRPRGFPGGWPAAVYPALAPDGSVSYFQARYLDPPRGRGKYDNPSGRWAANPRLAWVRPARMAAERGGGLIVTEGIADALAAARLGKDALGVLGTAVIDKGSTDRILTWAQERACRVVLCFDGDEAGRTAARRLLDELAAAGVDDARLIRPPDGMDLTDWVRRDQAAVVAELADESTRARPDPTIPSPAHALAR